MSVQGMPMMKRRMKTGRIRGRFHRREGVFDDERTGMMEDDWDRCEGCERAGILILETSYDPALNI